MEIPPTFKVLTTYIRRAEELDRDTLNPNSAIIAYFCRLYAIDKGMKMGLPQTEMGFLLQIMDIAEAAAKANPSIKAADGKGICQDFALHVFSIADSEDRGAGSTMVTAKTFYAAGAYFDILEQFGELEPDVAEKRRYCKWKTADITRAVKEGRKPKPGGADEDITAPAATSAPESSAESDIPAAPTASIAAAPAPISAPAVGEYDAQGIPNAPSTAPFVPPPSLPIAGYNAAPIPPPQPPVHYAQPSVQPTPQQYQPPVPAPVSAPVYSMPHGGVSGAPPKSMSDPRAKDCMELCQYAMSALKHNDMNLAKERLIAALRLLE